MKELLSQVACFRKVGCTEEAPKMAYEILESTRLNCASWGRTWRFLNVHQHTAGSMQRINIKCNSPSLPFFCLVLTLSPQELQANDVNNLQIKLSVTVCLHCAVGAFFTKIYALGCHHQERLPFVAKPVSSHRSCLYLSSQQIFKAFFVNP